MGDDRRYEVQDSDNDEATIYLYDVIGDYWGDGVSAKQFAADLSEITAGTIHLRINSPGGDVFDARAMQTALRQHPARVVAHIDGLAASAATYVMLGADDIEAVEGAMFMIHNAWALVIGNKNDMRKMAETLDRIDEGIAADYVAKTGVSTERVREWMDAETDFTAAEALENGFIDRIYAPEKATKRDAEKALRDAGFSASQAKRILSDGFTAADTRDAGSDLTPEQEAHAHAAPDAAGHAAAMDALRRNIELMKNEG
jgi:ATP-dependent Clp protease protease subunit